jgi:hypothetical protein
MPGILLATGYACLLLLLMQRMRFYNTVPSLPWHWLGYLFVLKILAGTGLWWIYTYLYPDRVTADVFKYFDDSAVMFSALPERPLDYLQMLFGIRNDTPYFSETYYMKMNNWFRMYESNVYNDAHTVIRFNALVRLFSFGEFHVHTVIAAFLSLSGMVGLYRAFVRFLSGREHALMIAIFLLPSVLLWASGVIKESLLFFGMGLMLHQFFRMLDRRISIAGIVTLGVSTLLLFYLKFYVLMSLLPALLLYMLTRNQKPVRIVIWIAIIYGGAALLVMNFHRIAPGFDVLWLLAQKQKDFIGLALGTNSGSFVMPPPLSPSIGSFILNSPYALYITLFGPMIHFSGMLGVLSALENAAIIGLFVILILFSRKWRHVDRPLIVSLLAYVTLLALVIGWTTPVMGAIVRYRTPLLPFLLIAGLMMFDHQKFLMRWPALKRFISA